MEPDRSDSTSQEGVMDPVSIILTALVGWAAAAAKDTASQAVKDAYAGLKSLVLGKLEAKQSNASTMVKEFERDSDTWHKPMEKSLETAGAASDEEIIRSARSLLRLVEPQQFRQGKYDVQVTGDVRGQIIGDNATQSNVFEKG